MPESQASIDFRGAAVGRTLDAGIRDNVAGSADIYQNPPFYSDKYSEGKYELIKELKEKQKALENVIRQYTEKHREYTQYMKDRGGEWNDNPKRNDMSGLGLSPGDDSEAVGWFYLGDTDTLTDCKQAALRDDKLYTRIVHYNPEDGYNGNWKYGCYGSVMNSKTSSNPKFNSIGVTTADRTYWTDTNENGSFVPPAGTNPGTNYGTGWFYLGRYGGYATDTGYERGFYACKELAKNPSERVEVIQPDRSVIVVEPMPYLKDKVFETVVYFDNNYRGDRADDWKGRCYGGVKNAQLPSSGGANVAGIWVSKQTRCMAGENSPTAKTVLVKELQAMYEDILIRKKDIDDLFSKIPGLKKEFGSMLNDSIYRIQFELQPRVTEYIDSVKAEEATISALDNLDSHVQMTAGRYKYVLYTLFVVALICGIYFILKSDGDTMYVEYALMGTILCLALFYAYSYFGLGREGSK
jgi:hypothetical protein